LTQDWSPAAIRPPGASVGHGGGCRSGERSASAARRHSLRIASSAAPTSCENGAPTSIDTSTDAYRPFRVSSRPSAVSDVVFPTCRGACSTKYDCRSMSCRTVGSRRMTGSM
jgi:hypothetical protein